MSLYVRTSIGVPCPPATPSMNSKRARKFAAANERRRRCMSGGVIVRADGVAERTTYDRWTREYSATTVPRDEVPRGDDRAWLAEIKPWTGDIIPPESPEDRRRDDEPPPFDDGPDHWMLERIRAQSERVEARIRLRRYFDEINGD